MKAKTSIGKRRCAIFRQLFFIGCLAHVHSAYADCDLHLTVKNNFDVPVNITTIKTAQTVPVPGTLKEHWIGTVRILSDGYHTFKFTVDAACVYERSIFGPLLPVTQRWTVRLFRSNGQTCTYELVDKTSSLAMDKNKCE